MRSYIKIKQKWVGMLIKMLINMGTSSTIIKGKGEKKNGRKKGRKQKKVTGGGGQESRREDAPWMVDHCYQLDRI